MTEQEIKSYLNYEDVQKELEEAKGLIKELMPLAKSGAMYYRQNPGFDWVSERDKSNSIIQRANEFLKMKEQDAAHSFDTTLKPTDVGYKWLTCSVCDGSGRMSQDQYIELTRLRSELQQKDETIKALIRGTEVYAKLRFDDQPFTPYQLALQEIESLKAKLESLRQQKTGD